MTAHDQLLQQLRESVGARRPARRRVFRGGGRALALAAALVVGAAALAAAQVGVLPGTAHHAHAISARQAAWNAVRETATTTACKRLHVPTVSTEIAAAALPLLGGPNDPEAQAFALRDARGAPLVAGSARRVVLPGNATVFLWLDVGDGTNAYADPAACGAERVAQLHRDYPDPGSRLRQKADAVLAGYRDVTPGLQTLWVMTKFDGVNAMGGTMIPLDRRTVAPGLVTSGSMGYAGLASPGVTTVSADGHGYHRTLHVVRRFYALRPPRGTGPVVLRERSAGGAVVATRTLRG
ncbi:hypothetical protein [Conexibacter woesei]|uniref:hypothetical protein n=1 Tax=Conexibacter woesei TaxID=191495 RepID=UPI00041838F5|nr:hypothetical protein [Conexibacter woesei]